MLWITTILIPWLTSAQGSHLLFAALAYCVLCDVNPRWIAAITVLLHLLLAL